MLVPMFSDILTLAASLLIAGSPKVGAEPYSLSTSFSPVESSRESTQRFLALISPQGPESQVARPEHSSALVPRAFPAISEPRFIRRPVLFERNSLELNPAGNNMLKRAATWLREHPDTRVLIVGSCDKTGSESCTHTLAEGRAAVIQKFLENAGVPSCQIAGVKGWDNAEHGCRPIEIKCQQLSRSAQIFLAGSIPP